MIVHHSGKKLTVVPPPLDNIARTHELTVPVLGVTFNSSLSFSQHMQNLTAKAATSLYALKTLKAHGLQSRTLRCDAGYTCGPNNLCWPLLERVYQSRRNSTLKGCNVKTTPLWIPSC